MTNLMLIGLVLFALIVSSDIILSQRSADQVVYVQNGSAASTSDYLPLMVIASLILVILLVV